MIAIKEKWPEKPAFAETSAWDRRISGKPVRRQRRLTTRGRGDHGRKSEVQAFLGHCGDRYVVQRPALHSRGATGTSDLQLDADARGGARLPAVWRGAADLRPDPVVLARVTRVDRDPRPFDRCLGRQYCRADRIRPGDDFRRHERARLVVRRDLRHTIAVLRLFAVVFGAQGRALTTPLSFLEYGSEACPRACPDVWMPGFPKKASASTKSRP